MNALDDGRSVTSPSRLRNRLLSSALTFLMMRSQRDGVFSIAWPRPAATFCNRGLSMHDPRLERLAEILVDHSCQVADGEKVLIEAFDLPNPAIVCRLVELVSERGGVPLVSYKNNAVLRSLYRHGTSEGMTLSGELERNRMERMDAYIGIRGAENSSQFADVPQEKMDLYQKHWWYPVHSEIRVPKTKWVVLRYPTPSMAQAAEMSCEAI